MRVFQDLRIICRYDEINLRSGFGRITNAAQNGSQFVTGHFLGSLLYNILQVTVVVAY